MRILHVITSLRTGGAEKLMVDLLPRLKSAVDEVALCVFDGTRTSFYEALEAQGVTIHSLGLSVYSPAHVFRLASLMQRYDVVHAHNTACQFYVAMAGLLVKRRLITTEHNTTNRRRGKWFWKILDRWMYGQYDRIICISDLTKENLLQHVGDTFREKCCVVHNGINVAAFQNGSIVLSKEKDVRTILMISAFREQKDQKTLISAMALLPSTYRLLLAGGGDASIISDCQQLAEGLGLTERVSFLGVRMDVPELLAQADVVVLSSHYEGLSLSSLEGMASGKPFVASDVEGLSDIVGGYGVLFPHGDEKCLAEKIRQLCEDEAYCAQVVEKCLERARMFDVSRMAKGYLDVYQLGVVMSEPLAPLPTYSVAIRTLGLATDKFECELRSIASQTVRPERVLVYVADDGKRGFVNGRFCGEEYIYVAQGMVAQRALPYDEVASDCILLLDDDVELAPDSAEKLLRTMAMKKADCVGADTYKNQCMPLWQKVYAVLTNWVWPHVDKNWAFKLHRHGSFSYLLFPPKGPYAVLPTQYVAGPCSLWRKDALLRLCWEDERWMDEMEFSYMDDTVESYKLHVNGGKMFLLYDSGVLNLNAKTASRSYRSKATMFYTRARLGFCVWWRTIYEVERRNINCRWQHQWTACSFVAKTLVQSLAILAACTIYLDIRIPYFFVRGIADGWRFVHSEDYRMIPPYRLV